MGKSKTLDPEAPVRIKDWRNRKEISRLELSRALGVSKTAVSNWELSLNEPDARTYQKLAEMADGPDREWFQTKGSAFGKEHSEQKDIPLDESAFGSSVLNVLKLLDTDSLRCILKAIENELNRRLGNGR
ncbi:MAG: helix-turn-helix transcriptional regulator [Terracidiphilus sp.]|nr:helix-turn-helix transcriptional regulator [Terracidiphilus sp.]